MSWQNEGWDEHDLDCDYANDGGVVLEYWSDCDGLDREGGVAEDFAVQSGEIPPFLEIAGH